MKGQQKHNRTVVMCMTESDAHVVANKLLDIYLTDNGWDVINLGVCTPLLECFENSEKNSPLAIVIGTQNGHAYEDLASLKSLKRKYGVNAPIVLGGNLSVGSKKTDDLEKSLLKLGVTKIISSFEALNEYLIEQQLSESNHSTPYLTKRIA